MRRQGSLEMQAHGPSFREYTDTRDTRTVPEGLTPFSITIRVSEVGLIRQQHLPQGHNKTRSSWRRRTAVTGHGHNRSVVVAVRLSASRQYRLTPGTRFNTINPSLISKQGSTVDNNALFGPF